MKGFIIRGFIWDITIRVTIRARATIRFYLEATTTASSNIVLF